MFKLDKGALPPYKPPGLPSANNRVCFLLECVAQSMAFKARSAYKVNI